MRRLFAVLLSAFLFFGFASSAHADVAGLTPCSENARFQERAATAATPQAEARFAMYGQALCGEEGLPRLIVDGRFSHAGDFAIPGVMFLYMAGWIGWAGRSYLKAIRGKGAAGKEIQIDVTLALTCAVGAAAWPVAALGEYQSGSLIESDDKITVSPR
ncbi:MAG: Photosystem I reaction center subunit III [Aphanocapsa feldmannii 277cV]|uniref:Photosystem I reaction center subunit III n=2 Tax=Aphanocapsa feldmannii TaxID=192050 RepID=A0A524RQS4_9CHRO|nr:MAG: Photosystem I reaction center subunit III [Aphanocapsa feldmannii 288cV]TGG96184.1 MAG: Photosystem I reaction center subunit III [Aphanocapsa feldmannii 277cV]TGH22149.1 MAG: Photosystem I reaction center subunit III [Aphanocapsa feldmannii 277cI]